MTGAVRTHEPGSRQSAAPRQETPRPVWHWVAALTVVALALRLFRLDAGLWVDEIIALIESIRPPLLQILTVYTGDNQHPLYSVLAHVAAGWFGESPWTVRLPAMLFGAATVPALYWLGTMVADRREALLAAALLTVSYHHIWFSQNARGYTGIAFFTVVATALLVEGIRTQRRGWFVGYAAVIALGAYTHLTIVFLAISQSLVCAALALFGGRLPGPREGSAAAGRGRLDWRLPALGYLLAAGLTLLLYAPMLGDVIWWFTERPSNFEGVSTPGWALREAFRSLGGGAGMAVVAGGGIIFLAGLLSYLRRSPAVFALFVLPGAVTLVLPLLIRGTMYPRFFFYLAGIALLVLIRGAVVTGGWLARAMGRPERAAIAGTTLAALLVAASAVTVPRNYRHPKQDFAGALSFVESTRGPGDIVVVAGAAVRPYRSYYRVDHPVVSTRAELRAHSARARDLWLLYTMPQYLPRFDAELAAILPQACAERRVFPGTLGGGNVYACRIDPGGIVEP